MPETTDWNSGQGAYPRDLDTWTLKLELPHSWFPNIVCDIVRNLSTRPTLDEIRSLCDDEMGDVEREVRVAWYLADPDGNETDGKFTLKPTGGAA